MKNNKSIDGLTVRSAKKQAPVSTVKKPTTPKKPVKKEIKVKSDEQPTEVKPKIKTKVKPDQTVDDFLKPVQAFDFDEESGELKESAAPKTKKEERVERKANKKLEKAEKKRLKKEELEASGKKSHKVRNIIASVVLVIVLAIIGVVIWALVWGNDIIAKITGGQGNVFDLFTFMDDNYQPLRTDANGRTNILAFGTSGYNMDGDEGNGTHAGAQLTDSIMMISLNQDTGDIAMLSLPRDLKATPTCTATGKINEVYWCKGGKGDATLEQESAAATALMNEVSGILGVEFQYYAHLNWGSLVQIVNTLGGITVKLDEDIHDPNWTGAVFDAGVEYTIDGAQALGLARARHGTRGGDFSRGNSQQKILIGIKNKLVEKQLSITDYLSLATALGDNLRSNFSVDELKTIAHLSYLFDLESMRQISLYDPANNIYYMKTANINGISYVVPSAGVGNYSAIHKIVSTLLDNDPRTYEQPKIAILNATGEAGVAAEQKAKLEEEGYTITTIDNIEGSFEENFTLYDLNTRTPGTTPMLEQRYAVTAKTGEEIPEIIPRDYDLVLVLGPSPSTSPEEITE